MFGDVAMLFRITWRSKQTPSHNVKCVYLKGFILFERKLVSKRIQSVFRGQCTYPLT